MAAEDVIMEEKCENLMNIVVESRKRFGKMCKDYEQKSSIMENKILNLQLETISNYRFKPKYNIPDGTENFRKDFEEFSIEFQERQERINAFKNRIKSAQNVVLQLKMDSVGKKLKEPITVENMLAQAKLKRIK